MIEHEGYESFGYRGRGKTYMLTGGYARAITDFTKAIENDPIDPSLYYDRGSIYNEQDDFDRAIADWTVVIHLTADATVYYKRGLVRTSKGESNQAIMDFTKAIERNPNFADSYDRRGELYLKQGDRVRAGADFIKAAQLRKTDTSPE